MGRFHYNGAVQVGIQIQPQATSVDAMRSAWRAADDLGADSIWIWDHFYPCLLYTSDAADE